MRITVAMLERQYSKLTATMAAEKRVRRNAYFGRNFLINASSLVLITTATKPPDGVYALEMTNVAKRKVTAKAAIFFWSALGVKKIIVADATGQTLLEESEVLLLNNMEVEIEQIEYLQDNRLVIQKGKGYGEGALIKYALQKSQLLKNENSFFKCTGKVYCRNFAEIFDLVQTNNIKNIFWRDALKSSTIDTRFFYVSKDFCNNVLLPVFESIDDKNNTTMEHAVMNAARQRMIQGTSIRPMLSGFSGGMDKPYFDSSLGFLDQNLPCWVSQ